MILLSYVYTAVLIVSSVGAAAMFSNEKTETPREYRQNAAARTGYSLPMT